MTDDKKLDLILGKLEKIDKIEADMRSIKPDMKSMKSDMQSMKPDMRSMKSDLQDMKTSMKNIKFDMQDLKSDIESVKKEVCSLESKVEGLDRRVRSLELHTENATDRNIQLLAENFVELTKKLNQAIPVADKNYAYEVKVNYLIEEVQDIQKRLKAGGLVTA